MSLRIIRLRNVRRGVDLNTATDPWAASLVMPVRYVFASRRGDPLWTPDEAGSWIRQFEQQTEATWSHRWLIRGERAPGGLCRQFPDVVVGWTGVCQREVVNVDISLDIRTISAALVGRAPFRWESEGEAQCTRHRLFIFPVNVWHRTAEGGDSVTAGQARRSSDGRIQLPQDGTELRRPLPGDPETAGYQQRASDHEVGHSLGLEHPVCEANELSCYGVPGHARADDVMGVGHRVSRESYQPFADMMQVLESSYEWTVRSETPTSGRDSRARSQLQSPFMRPDLHPHADRYRA